MPAPKSTYNATQILFPIGLIALVVFISTAFQTMQAFRDHTLLHEIKSQQDKPLEDTRRLQAQLVALTQGTLKLAEGGDKNAQAIIDHLKKAGLTISSTQTDGSTSSPLPSEHIARPSKF